MSAPGYGFPVLAVPAGPSAENAMPISPAPTSLAGLPRMPRAVFGLLAGSRPVNLDFRQTPSATRFVAEVLAPAQAAELALFLLPGSELPPGSGAVVYFAVPPFSSWSALTTLTAMRPSSIVRTGWSANAEVAAAPVVQVGVSLEPLADVEAAHEALRGKEVTEQLTHAQLVARDLFSFLGSFQQSIAGVGERLVVPTDAIDKWIAKFENKFRMFGPGFLYR